jgi:hypothetical protein
MFGKTRREYAYYVCQPQGTAPEGHPKSLWVRETGLINGVNDFLARRIFGPRRADPLTKQLSTLNPGSTDDRADRIAALRRALSKTETRRRRLLASLEHADDSSGELAREVNSRLADLRATDDATRTQLCDAETAPARPRRPAYLINYQPSARHDSPHCRRNTPAPSMTPTG